VVTVQAADPQSAQADNLWLHACSFYGNDDVGAGVWSHQQAGSSFAFPDECTQGGVNGFGVSSPGEPWGGHWGQWGISSPAGIQIDSAWTPPWGDQGVLINCDQGNAGFASYYVWGPNQGSQRIFNHDGGGCPYGGTLQGMADGTPINTSFSPTNWFGIQSRCIRSSTSQCDSLAYIVAVRGIQLGATETATPSLNAYGANNLFYHAGYVRGGGFTIALGATDPSGICDLGANLNGTWIQGPSSGLNQSSWVQCSAPSPWTGPSINTENYPDGTKLQLFYRAEDAAGNWQTSTTSTSYTDNSPVELSLAGPTHASIRAGTAFVAATASVNPSGDTIWCSTDGAQWVAYLGTSAQIGVNGLGSHLVRCFAEDGAMNASGSPGRSSTETWSLDIGEPVHGKITFGKLISRCREMPKRVGKRVKHIRQCRRLWEEQTVRQVHYGERATVRGWFATVDGAVLAHVPVSVETAVDNGRDRWRRVALVHTGANGSWRAKLPRGPSRLVEAVYGGGLLTAPKTTRVVRLLVPARVVLTSVPSHVPWGATLAIHGRVLGGYIPGGQILRVLTGTGKHLQLIGNPTIERDGRFTVHLATVGSGGPLRTAVAVGTLKERDFPRAPGLSRRAWITIG
jgi:hypothetical protein